MRKKRLSTRAVHGGETRPRPYGAVTTPIVPSSTYAFESTREILDFVERKAAGDPALRHEYGRYGNPTVAVAEQRVADLEGAEKGLVFATGMGAITTTLLTFLAHGDHVVIASGTYRQTRNLATEHMVRWGIEATVLEDGHLDRLEEAVRPTTRLIFFETPTNPFLRVIDVDRVASIARRHSVLTAVDATFATPINLRPLEHGIDLVIHSATKYLAGHNDLLAGVVVGERELLSKIEASRGVFGGMGSAFDAYLLIRGLKTLELRVRRQNETGQRIANRLAGHPAVRCVHYPGLRSHPDHAIAARLLSGFGGVVSFEVAGGREAASRVIDALRIPHIGPTLGGVESIAQQQALFISSDESERRKHGIPDSLIRYAAGIEDAEDLIDDLDQALACAEVETSAAVRSATPSSPRDTSPLGARR